MKNKTFLAEKHINGFYDDAHNPSKPTKENTNGDFLFQYNDLKNNTDNFLFVDGSIVSNGGDYREMSSVILPEQEKLELSFVQSEYNTYELKITKNKSSDNSIDYSTKTLILSDDECGYIKMSDEQGFNESLFLDKEGARKFIINEFGLNAEQMVLTIKNKNKEIVKQQHSGILSFINKISTKKDKPKTKFKNNKPS
jgi:hypothetical protein